MTGVQRAILIVAGLLLLGFAMLNVASNDMNGWLATATFVVAVICFYLAARPSDY